MLKILPLLFFALTLRAAPVPAKITFADGSAIEGKLSLMGSRPIFLSWQDSTRSHNSRNLRLEDILQITQTVESAKMEKPWMFKESGKTEKVYFDGEYPLINFTTEILLVNGELLRGRIIAVAFRFKGPGTPSKLFLQRQIKGKTGQKMDDLRYISKIELANKPAGKTEPVRGSVSGIGKLLQATAVDAERNVVLHAEIKGDSFTFPAMLPGKYDLFLLTDEAVFSGFAGKTPVPETIRKNVKLADDFFNDRFILAFDGARTLIYKRRSSFYASQKHVKGGFIWHLELWNWHAAGNEWKLDSRDLVLRHKNIGGEKLRRLHFAKELSGVAPGSSIRISRENGHEVIRILD